MEIKRYSRYIQSKDDVILKNMLRNEYISNPSLRKTNIDIILPTFNRAHLLRKAIDSVRGQLHKSWNLYVCDDGSIDKTSQVLKIYEKDYRIKCLFLPHRGVSHARNIGIQNTQNNFLSFIDSDNSWNPEYLSLMIAFMSKFSLTSAYCAARLIDDYEELWLGDLFSWQACAQQNYIDLNCFITKQNGKKIVFDEKLERFVDWDYILGITKTGRTSYLPCSLVDYCNRQSRHRISTSVYQNGIENCYLNRIRSKYRQIMGEKERLDVRISEFK